MSSTRMMNKLQQLILRPSGDPTYGDIRGVTLRSDGRMFGRVFSGSLKGYKVVAQSYRGRLWETVDER